MPRQNGKSAGILTPLVMADLFLATKPVLLVWTAHKVKTAKEAFLDMRRMILETPELESRVNKISAARGDEGFELTNGARLNFLARINGGGRGLSGDTIVLDEALFLTADMMGDLLPTKAARPDPHVLYGSSAGKAVSGPLRALRDRGRPGGDPALAYAEWTTLRECASQPCPHTIGTRGCVLDDRVAWREANPRIALDELEDQRLDLPPEEFAREFLGWWDDPSGAESIGFEAWAARAVRADLMGRFPQIVGRVTFAADVAPNQRAAAISVCGLNAQGVPQVEVVEHRPGTAWLAGRVRELVSGGADVVVNPGAAVNAVLPELKRELVEPVLMGVQDVAQACGLLQAAVNAKPGADVPIAHLGDPLVTAALQSAGTRAIGDGQWAWSHKASDADITALTSVTWAFWRFVTTVDADYDLMASVR
jgi:hypothetical protein